MFRIEGTNRVVVGRRTGVKAVLAAAAVPPLIVAAAGSASAANYRYSVAYNAPGCSTTLQAGRSDTTADTTVSNTCGHPWDSAILVRAKYKMPDGSTNIIHNNYAQGAEATSVGTPNGGVIVQSCHAFGVPGQPWGPDFYINQNGSTGWGCSFN